ncbi:MAG TPA: antitoxin family protein [Gemmataceae bacterium]|nr:antitoxin family protein [Gemmataceae bacterium]
MEAVYEHGTLKLPRELPLQEGQKVTITIQLPGGIVERAHGRLQSPLGREDLERAALDPEFDIVEGP